MKTENTKYEIEWPEDCQFGKGLDGFTVLFNRELLRRKLGLSKPAPTQPRSVVIGRQR